MLLILALGACIGGGEGPTCDDACPVNTRPIRSQESSRIVEGTVAVDTEACTATCEPLQPCLSPNIPVITDGDPDVYSCEPLDGFNQIPPLGEVDTSFGLIWREVPDPLPTSLPLETSSVEAVDLDGDGLTDLVGQAGWSWFVAYSLGDGTFGAPVLTPVDVLPKRFAAGDLDGDGFVDLVWTDWDHDIVRLSRGQPDGTFAAGEVLGQGAPPGYNSMGVVVGDVDGDGALDVVLDDFQQDAFGVIRGHGDGTFDAPVAVPTGVRDGNDMAGHVADIDGDGLLDLLAVRDGISVLRNVGGLAFVTEHTALGGGTSNLTVGVFDLNDDGRDDLIFPSASCSDGLRCNLLAYGPDLVPEELPYVSAEGPLTSIGDADGDGRADLAGPDGLGVDFVLTNGGQPLVMTRLWPEQSVVRVLGGDFDGDGIGEALAVGLSDGGATDLLVVFP